MNLGRYVMSLSIDNHRLDWWRILGALGICTMDDPGHLNPRVFKKKFMLNLIDRQAGTGVTSVLPGGTHGYPLVDWYFTAGSGSAQAKAAASHCRGRQYSMLDTRAQLGQAGPGL